MVSINGNIRKQRLKIENIFMHIFLILLSVLAVVPFFWMFSSSLKFESDIFTIPIKWIPDATMINYNKLFNEVSFIIYIFNSLKLTFITTVGQVFTSSIAAYSFAKLKFPGRDKLFLLYLSTLMIPWHAIMIPQFIIIKNLGLYDSHLSLILLQLFNPFGVFILRQFFLSVPNELSEAARIDGYSEFGIYLKIMLPLSKAALATLTIFVFKFVWNDYLGPLIYLNTENLFTIQIGLRSFFGENKTEYGPVLAGSCLSVLPVLIIYVSAQKYFVQGIAISGLKG